MSKARNGSGNHCVLLFTVNTVKIELRGMWALKQNNKSRRGQIFGLL